MRSIHIPGVKHVAPIPVASRVGPVIYSSGIGGVDAATGQTPDDAQQQAVHAFRNMRAAVEAGGGSMTDVVRVTFYVKDDKYRALLNPLWLEYFPDEDDRPARHVTVDEHLRGTMLVQLEFMAVCADGR